MFVGHGCRFDKAEPRVDVAAKACELRQAGVPGDQQARVDRARDPSGDRYGGHDRRTEDALDVTRLDRALRFGEQHDPVQTAPGARQRVQPDVAGAAQHREQRVAMPIVAGRARVANYRRARP